MKEDKRKVMMNGREENVSLNLEVDRGSYSRYFIRVSGGSGIASLDMKLCEHR